MLQNSIKHQGDRGRLRPGVQYALVAALAAVIVFWNLGTAVLDEHECYVALTAKAMSSSDPNQWLVQGEGYDIPPRTALNRWMVPVENGRPRLVKTPLPYWTAAACMTFGGGATNFTTRASSAVCAVLLAVVTLAIGRALLPPRAALLGTLMLVTSIGFQRWGRDARPEIMLCLLAATAMLCFYKGATAPGWRAHVGWMAAFWVTMGLANLAKEFVPMLLAWPLAAFVFWRGSQPPVTEYHAPLNGDGPLSLEGRGQGEGVHGHCRGPHPHPALPATLSLPGRGVFPPQLPGGGTEALPGDHDRRSLRLLRLLLASTLVGLTALVVVTTLPALRWWTPLGISDSKGYYVTMAAALGLPMLWYLWACRGLGPVGQLLPTALPGAAIMLAMFLPWMEYMKWLFPGLAMKVFVSQVSDRAAGTGGFEVMSPDRYLSALVTLTLPWLAFLPGAFIMPLMKRFSQSRQGLVFLLLWAVGLIVLFASTAGKREHYILPAIPAVCLLMGFAAEDVLFGHRWINQKLARLLVAGHGVVAVLGVAAVAGAWWLVSAVLHGQEKFPRWIMDAADPWVQAPSAFPVVLAFAAIAAAAWILACVAFVRGREGRVIPLMAGGMAIMVVGFWSFIGLYDQRKAISEFAREASRIIPPGDPVYSWNDAQAKTVFYFGRFIPAIQWQFLHGVSPEQRAKNGNIEERYLRDNPRLAPWIFGYGGDAEFLGRLGYRVRLSREDTQIKSGQPQQVFMLFQR